MFDRVLKHPRTPKLVMKFVIVATMTFLAGCGFSPAFAPNTGAGVRLEYTLKDPGNPIEWEFRRALASRMPNQGTSGPLLNYSVTISETEIISGRINLLARVDFHSDVKYNGVTVTGTAQSFVSYSTSGQIELARSVYAARTDAISRVSNVLAQMVYSKLIAIEAKKGSHIVLDQPR